MTQTYHNLSPDYDVEEAKPVEVDETEAGLTLLGRTTFYGNVSMAGTTAMQGVLYPSEQAKEEFKQIILGVQDE